MKNGKNLLLIYNTEAGKTPLAQMLDSLLKELYDLGFTVTVCPVGGSRDPQELLRSQGGCYDIAACVGGDGTLHYTVNTLLALDRTPLLGYLPAGSTNDFAATLGLTGDLKQGCLRLAQGEACPLDVGDFCGQKFCYVAAFGIFTEVSYSASREMKNLLGHFAYILEGVRRLDLFQSWHARICVDGQELEDDFWYGSVTNATSVGGFSFPAAGEVRLDDGRFEVLLVRRPRSLLEIHELVTHLGRQDFSSEHLRFFRASQVEFSFDREVPWTLDGEFGGSVQRAAVQVLPGAVRLLV